MLPVRPAVAIVASLALILAVVPTCPCPRAKSVTRAAHNHGCCASHGAAGMNASPACCGGSDARYLDAADTDPDHEDTTLAAVWLNLPAGPQRAPQSARLARPEPSVFESPPITLRI